MKPGSGKNDLPTSFKKVNDLKVDTVLKEFALHDEAKVLQMKLEDGKAATRE